MNVKELMTKDPESCIPEDNCAAALEIMQRRNCGFVPVAESPKMKRVIGVVTDRDIALHLRQVDRAPSEVWVGGCMTQGAKTVSPEASLTEAAAIMEKAAVHRLPVVQDGLLVGVLSLQDIACQARKEWASPEAHVAERQMADIVEAISIARGQ